MHTGNSIEDQVPDDWLWQGHRVVCAAGATVTMTNTPDNQAEYPQSRTQATGCGFPIMLFALATGVVLETAMGKYRGKLTAEVSYSARSTIALKLTMFSLLIGPTLAGSRWHA